MDEKANCSSDKFLTRKRLGTLKSYSNAYKLYWLIFKTDMKIIKDVLIIIQDIPE